MAEATITGTVQSIGELFEKGDFKKKSLIVKEDKDKYPQTFEIEFIKDKEELLDLISIGDKVKVDVNLRCREWNSPSGDLKYFPSFAGWRITKV